MREQKAIEILMQIVVERGGMVQLHKPLFPRIWGIATVKAVTIDYKKLSDDWNAKCEQINRAVGVQKYCEWVENENYEIIGAIACYSPNGDEIKMKWFVKGRWQKLLKAVESTT